LAAGGGTPMGSSPFSLARWHIAITAAVCERQGAMVDEDAFEESMRCSPLAAAGPQRGRLRQT
jgi:hypothetical protein